MADAIDGWEKAVAAAQKILGKDAVIPPQKPAIGKAMDAYDAKFAEFDKAREELEDKLLELIDSAQAAVDAMEQMSDALSDEEFNLDPKKDKQKIVAAQKLLTGVVKKSISEGKGVIKDQRELNKHLAHISSYKQGKI